MSKKDLFHEEVEGRMEKLKQKPIKKEKATKKRQKKRKERAKKDLGGEWGVPADEAVRILGERLGSDNVKVVEKI